MFHWRQDYFAALRNAADQAQKHPTWVDYARYCATLESGQRKVALAHLTTFIRSTAEWTVEERREFLRWILPLAHEAAGELLLPYPLLKDVVKPTIDEELRSEPPSLEARRWTNFAKRFSWKLFGTQA